MSWNDEMAKRREAAELNKCREVVEVQSGIAYKTRKLMEEYPQYSWKYAEGLTIPGYMIKIAAQLEKEFHGSRSVPTDLFPCEYFRIIDHSTPTEMAIQPKRFDKVQEHLSKKLQEFYANPPIDLQIPDSQLLPRIACAVCIDNTWYRGKLENVPNVGPWIYVYLVDVGASRQVAKTSIRYLDSKLGVYPPMVVRARVRGALIQNMDYDKVDRFRETIREADYLTRCQITSSSEPFLVNVFHPSYEHLNICAFLLAPRRGKPSVEGIWPPKTIARDLNRENGIESDHNNDSGADSDDFVGDEEDDDDGWNFEEESNSYFRSFPPACKIFRSLGDDLQVERIQNELLLFLTNDNMRQRRQEIDDYLTEIKDSLTHLPDVWLAFGTACAVSHKGKIKRAAICSIHDSSLKLLLIDEGITIESNTLEVFSLPNKDPVNIEPQLTLISLAAFDFIHFSRVQILRNLLPSGTPVQFERERRSKDIPTKGNLFLPDGTSIENLVNERVFTRNLNLQCFDIVPYFPTSAINNYHHTHSDDFILPFKQDSVIIYKKSKNVSSIF